LYAFAKAVNLKSKSNLISKYVRNGKHLDIGAGVGDLVKAARDKGIDSEGAEPSPKARTVAKDKGVSLKTSTSVFKDDEVSVITMYHVLEHVPNLDEQISEIDRLLKDEGILILALPNIKSWDAKYFNKYWAGYDVPRHLHHFSKRSIKGLLEKRFQLIETKPMWFDSFYVSILSARYQKRKFPFLQGLALGMISNLSALLTKEPSSITFVLKKRF
jgi:2-polyprenyl-3-methyl-5-hydroxy-6-metoxy-1,4-benzoquinol methylase